MIDLTKFKSLRENVRQVVSVFVRDEMEMNDTIIKDLIVNTETRRNEQEKNYLNYCGKQLPVENRKESRTDGIDNKLKNDFRGDIVDTIQGYFMGEPITYNYEGDESGQNALHEMAKIYNFPDLDSQTAKYNSICGECARLVYVQQDSRVGIINVPPWEVIFVDDPELKGNQIALRLYKVEELNQQGIFVKKWVVVWYERDLITTFTQNEEGKFYAYEQIPNMFGDIPLINFVNNHERLNDFDKVTSLIDGYDMVTSYNQDETEALRNAYLKLMGGAELDEEERQKLRNSGVLQLPENTDAEFLTKDLSDNFNENHLKRLETNIYKFSKTPNYLDKEFQAASGIALLYRLLPLENKAINKERKFELGLMQMFRVMQNYLSKIGIKIDYLKLDFVFTRNLPVDLLSEADATSKLKGLVTEVTRLSQLSFVRDAQKEANELNAEKETNVNLDGVV